MQGSTRSPNISDEREHAGEKEGNGVGDLFPPNFVVEVGLSNEEEEIRRAKQERRNSEVNGGVTVKENHEDGNGPKHDGHNRHHTAGAVSNEVGGVEAELERKENAGGEKKNQNGGQQVGVCLVDH